MKSSFPLDRQVAAQIQNGPYGRLLYSQIKTLDHQKGVYAIPKIKMLRNWKKQLKIALINVVFCLFSAGDPNDLYEFVVSNDISVLQGCGLGGGSLINANVALDADPKVFESPVWPKELREDLKNLNDVDRKHFYDMIQPRPYPDSYPSLPKTEAMRRAAEGLGLVDVEDLGKVHRKLDL